MNYPPNAIDNVKVIYWLDTGSQPAYQMPVKNTPSHITISRIAICSYGDGDFYRFLCNNKWEVENDTVFQSIEDTMDLSIYGIASITWIKINQ